MWEKKVVCYVICANAIPQLTQIDLTLNYHQTRSELESHWKINTHAIRNMRVKWKNTRSGDFAIFVQSGLIKSLILYKVQRKMLTV